MNEDTRKHLDFIQSAITRMSTNSFQIKGMTITVVTALITVYVATGNIIFIFLSGLPSLFFWFLDSYYLLQERKLRGIYEDVAEINNKVNVKLFEMPMHKYNSSLDKKYRYWNVFFSKTIAILYIAINLIVFLLGIIISLL